MDKDMPLLPDKDGSRRQNDARALLLGVGLDNQDGHVRVTRGEEFYLVGGSRDTHEHMQEKVIKFTEELGRRGKRLADVSPKEFLDIAHRVKLTDGGTESNKE